MRPFDAVPDPTKSRRFAFLRGQNVRDITGPKKQDATAFLEFYADYQGDIYESMQAALDTNTPYAIDLGQELLTAILEGKVP